MLISLERQPQTRAGQARNPLEKEIPHANPPDRNPG